MIKLIYFISEILATGNATFTTVPDGEPTASGTTLISGYNIHI